MTRRAKIDIPPDPRELAALEPPRMSRRQITVLTLALEGLPTRRIAQLAGCSRETVFEDLRHPLVKAALARRAAAQADVMIVGALERGVRAFRVLDAALESGVVDDVPGSPPQQPTIVVDEDGVLERSGPVTAGQERVARHYSTLAARLLAAVIEAKATSVLTDEAQTPAVSSIAELLDRAGAVSGHTPVVSGLVAEEIARLEAAESSGSEGEKNPPECV